MDLTAESPCLTQTRPLQVENRGFRAGVRRSVGGAVGRDAQAGAISRQRIAISLSGLIPVLQCPYLLGGIAIERVNQVWCSDITFIPMAKGFLYLVVVMDWVSRAVLAWRLSNTLGADF
jgi:transposase InsO family protein